MLVNRTSPILCLCTFCHLVGEIDPCIEKFLKETLENTTNLLNLDSQRPFLEGPGLSSHQTLCKYGTVSIVPWREDTWDVHIFSVRFSYSSLPSDPINILAKGSSINDITQFLTPLSPSSRVLLLRP